MSNGFIYVVDAHFIDKIEESKYAALYLYNNVVLAMTMPI
jgi:hypothetical protein